MITSRATFFGSNKGHRRLLGHLRLSRATLHYPQFVSNQHDTGLSPRGQPNTVYHFFFCVHYIGMLVEIVLPLLKFNKIPSQ